MRVAGQTCEDGAVLQETAITEPRRVRSLFVSDVHLGIRFSRARVFADFLDAYDPEHVYILGDFIDGWSLRRSWRWTADYNRILQRLFQWARRGVRVRYTPGNHDACFRDLFGNFGGFEIAEEFIHQAADQRRYVVMHGDRFDDIETSAPVISRLGGMGYELLLWTNWLCSRVCRRLGCIHFHFSGKIKKQIKTLVAYLSSYEQRLVQHAQSKHCHGVICGHTHTPHFAQHGEITYYNTGDWIEHCSAIIEFDDGELRPVRYTPTASAVVRGRNGASPRPQSDDRRLIETATRD